MQIFLRIVEVTHSSGMIRRYRAQIPAAEGIRCGTCKKEKRKKKKEKRKKKKEKRKKEKEKRKKEKEKRKKKKEEGNRKKK
jgi:hypothetical protein